MFNAKLLLEDLKKSTLITLSKLLIFLFHAVTNIANPRDVMVTLSNTVLEATMSRRSRYYEFYAYRDIVTDYYQSDPLMNWVVAPRPKMQDSSYNTGWWYKTNEDLIVQYKRNDFTFSTNQNEIMFDAADLCRLGEDVLVYHSNTTNMKGVEWLRRNFKEFTFHTMHFPDDLRPWHFDVCIMPLRKGLVMFNPYCPPQKELVDLFKEADWRIVYSTGLHQ